MYPPRKSVHPSTIAAGFLGLLCLVLLILMVQAYSEKTNKGTENNDLIKKLDKRNIENAKLVDQLRALNKVVKNDSFARRNHPKSLEGLKSKGPEALASEVLRLQEALYISEEENKNLRKHMPKESIRAMRATQDYYIERGEIRDMENGKMAINFLVVNRSGQGIANLSGTIDFFHDTKIVRTVPFFAENISPKSTKNVNKTVPLFEWSSYKITIDAARRSAGAEEEETEMEGEE